MEDRDSTAMIPPGEVVTRLIMLLVDVVSTWEVDIRVTVGEFESTSEVRIGSAVEDSDSVVTMLIMSLEDVVSTWEIDIGVAVSETVSLVVVVELTSEVNIESVVEDCVSCAIVSCREV